jgi:hypothetical protein
VTKQAGRFCEHGNEPPCSIRRRYISSLAERLYISFSSTALFRKVNQ